ncbi:MAG: ATP-dependent DNA helicase RecG, partial [Candidatus Zophobacter franzmannii]|nr:ATP-dependent DNA helicase RecG [Candidatus Zophobacter franzmannii]
LSDTSKVMEIKKRFILEEFLYTQILWQRTKKNGFKRGITFHPTGKLTKLMYEHLPYSLTEAQRRVVKELFSDMSSERQMNRLMQGDVGAGKTIVTLFAMLLAVENGYQATLLAPTEILAEQHFKTIGDLMSIFPDIHISLLKGGNYKGKKDILADIASGKSMIIIGTHALLQKTVVYHKVGLTVVDEQHRFGVQQRAELAKKNGRPDMLYLSATPIPRSLALTVYGDLEISVLDELPPGRKPIKTIWKSESKKQLVYEEIKKVLSRKRQIYIVCPLIEDTEKSDLLAAETLYEHLSNNTFKNYRCAILHGRMKNREKDATMIAFKNREIDILISTTVIEVGIDVPNASVMMIEHSERFGLSQLHQLRGRVGRGSDASFCYLISYPPLSKIGAERLRIMTETNDGFVIAERDLDLRGPGEFFGTKQSGLPVFKFANIVRDKGILSEAKELATRILKADPELVLPENQLIKDKYETEYRERESLFKY